MGRGPVIVRNIYEDDELQRNVKICKINSKQWNILIEAVIDILTILLPQYFKIIYFQKICTSNKMSLALLPITNY